MPRRFTADGENDVCAVSGMQRPRRAQRFCFLSGFCAREDQQESRGMTDARDVEALWPLAAWHRRHVRLSGGARELALQRGFEPRDGVCKRHGTMDMNGQELCGAG